MVIEQIVDIPADYRIFLELPRSIPIGGKARVKVNISAVTTNSQNNALSPSAEIEDIRQLLQKEMAKKGTLAITTTSGDGWEAHAKERYAEF